MDILYQTEADHFRAPCKTGANQKIPYIYLTMLYQDNRQMSTADYSSLFVYKDGHIDYAQTS